jgi:hypothetical protein
MSIIPMWTSLRELIAEHFARLAADKLNQEFPGHELGIVGFLVDVSPVIAHYATEQRRTFTTRRLRGERSPRRKLICLKQNLVVSWGLRTQHQLHVERSLILVELPHVEHLGKSKSRYSIVHDLGHTCRFICAGRRWTRRKCGRNGREPTKRCAWRANWRGEYVGQPEQQVGTAHGSRAAAAAHKRPGDSAVYPKR